MLASPGRRAILEVVPNEAEDIEVEAGLVALIFPQCRRLCGIQAAASALTSVIAPSKLNSVFGLDPQLV